MENRATTVCRKVWVLPLLSLYLGCTGSIGESDRVGLASSSGSPTNGGSTVGPGAPGAGGPLTVPRDPSSVPPQLADKCGAIDPGATYVRRLTRFEYDNSVRDLLGDATHPARDFPSEELTLGLDNNATALQVSPALAEQYMLSAEKLASTAVAGDMSRLVGCDAGTEGAPTCSQRFIASFGSKAFRRPLDAEETARFQAVFNAGLATDFATGVRLVVEVALQSAPFLYRIEFGSAPKQGEPVVPLTSYEMATRLSYLLWETTPDDTLLAAAKNDELTKPEAVRAHVTRMMSDPKAHDTVAHFNEQWLQLGKMDSMDKDAKIFQGWSADLSPSLAQGTRAFLEDVMWNGAGDLNALFTSTSTFMDSKTATYFGVAAPSGTGMQRVVDSAPRKGILGQPGILAMLAKTNQTSPIHRGKFVREQLFCAELPPPPAGLVIKPPELNGNLSTRERFTQHRTDPSCNGCHQLMDPLGFGFENFDGTGRYRTMENGIMVDASGEIVQTDVAGAFTGLDGLSAKLAASTDVRDCVSTSWFRFAAGRSESTSDECSRAVVGKRFTDSGYKVAALLQALTETDAFLYRRVIPAGGAQ